MTAEKETIFEVNKLILEQTNDLWLIAMGLIAFEVLLIAHVIYSLRIDFRESIVSWFLFLSVLFHALSLMFGYFAKGALIKIMISYSTSGTWTFDRITEWMNLLQIVSVTIGLIIFVVAFYFYSRTLARAIVTGVKK